MSAMASFQPVNTGLASRDPSITSREEVTTPTTPRPGGTSILQKSDPTSGLSENALTATTTSSSLSGQLPLPNTSFVPTTEVEVQRSLLHRGTSHSSAQSSTGAEEMDLDGSDDDRDGSDNDTENGESGRSSKKKKGQRFFCTDFPPCNLSFTRSEHLARHIRKHTGERPFQCHCNRRFSRLDNLRQHAQTVHVNEEIPGDSLAATGTRFQRQIRTDRVRSTGGRPRAGTVGSTGSHSRGHSRNLSTSSIGSTNSNYSTNQEPRRRPPPLIMAGDGSGRPKLALDPPTTPPTQYRGYQTTSPGGLGTPTSATYSGGPGSPNYGSSLGSPISNTSRTSGFFGTTTPGRRLSVPSGANPFQAPHGGGNLPSYLSPLASSSLSFSNNSSVYASPTSSTPPHSRTDPNVQHSEEWRRRTWHPSTYPAAGFNYSRPATSGLTYSQTPDAPQPAFAQHATAAAGHAPRLPGIESFDQVQHRPSTPPRRQPSPMQIDVAPQLPGFSTSNLSSRTYPSAADHRRGHVSWDMSLHSNLTRLDIQGNQGKESPSWGQQTINEIQEVASRPSVTNPSVSMPRPGPPTGIHQQGRQTPLDPVRSQSVTHQRNKRHGWYNGPRAVARTSPEDSSSSEGVPTPGTSAAEVHPAIMHSNGYIEPQHPVLAPEGHPNPCIPPSHLPSYTVRQESAQRANYYASQGNNGNDMGRLEALVAVATSEDKATTAAR